MVANASNQKDIVIRIQGQDLTGGAFKSVTDRLKGFVHEVHQTERGIRGIEKILGVLGIGGGLAGDLVGRGTTAGRIASGISSIAGSAAAGGLIGGPWGAFIGGGIEAIRQMRDYRAEVKETAKAFDEMRESFRKHFEDIMRARAEAAKEAGNKAIPDVAQPSGAFAAAAAARKQINDQIDELTRTIHNAQALGIDAGESWRRRTELFQQRRTLGNAMNFGVGLARLFERGPGPFSRAFEGGMQSLQRNLAGPAGDIARFFSNTQAQLSLEGQIQSPAARLQRELNDLDRMHREGVIGNDLFSRSRRALGLRAAAGLDFEGPAPGLAVTESRMLTRGRTERSGADKIIDVLKENRKQEQEDLRTLATKLLDGAGIIQVK